jgi:hypothetical protein
MHSEGVLKMPTFRVKGCFKETVEDFEIILEATSYKDVQRIANQKGILVLDVLVAEDSSVKDSDTPVLSSTSSESKPKSVEDQNNVLLPHHDGFILKLGILSLCCFPIGIANWLFANQDIKAMESGKMDSSGMGKTKAGKMLSIISLIFALMVIVVVVVDPIEPTSNSSNHSAQKRVDASNRVPEATGLSHLYRITNDEHMQKIKRSVEIVVDQPLTEEQLRVIANDIRESDSTKYDRTFIGYRLADQTADLYWATTHFNPVLVVKIQGITADEWEHASDFSISGEWDVIGKWLDLTPYIGGKVVIYIKDGKTYKNNTYQDGSGGSKEVVESTSPLGRRFDDVNGSNAGDHWIIDSKGDLQCWDDDGWISTANAN